MTMTHHCRIGRGVLLSIVLLCGATASRAQAVERRLALLDLPGLRALVAAGKSVDGFTAQVYDAPSFAAKSRRVQAGEKPGQLVLKEHGYEEYSVVVLERRLPSGQRWVRVALVDGSAWLPEPLGARSRTYADLVKESLAFLTEAWDGRVWDAPGGTPGSAPKSVAFRQIQRPEHPADVFEYREVNGQLWLHVNVLSESPCETQQPLSLIEGWVPAYNARGQWTADFYSRGC